MAAAVDPDFVKRRIQRLIKKWQLTQTNLYIKEGKHYEVLIKHFDNETTAAILCNICHVKYFVGTCKKLTS